MSFLECFEAVGFMTRSTSSMYISCSNNYLLLLEDISEPGITLEKLTWNVMVVDRWNDGV